MSLTGTTVLKYFFSSESWKKYRNPLIRKIELILTIFKFENVLFLQFFIQYTVLFNWRR